MSYLCPDQRWHQADDLISDLKLQLLVIVSRFVEHVLDVIEM